MKYFEDEKLTQFTSELSDAAVGGTNCRVINGRIEAYIMKRAGSDKKYAHKLGERYAAEMEDVETQVQTYQQFLERHSTKFGPPTPPRRKRSQSVGAQSEAPQPSKRRTRSSSFDATASNKKASSATPQPQPSMKRISSAPGYFSHSSLGDFHEMGTRRLMTDLILTLNASFPDYDFGNVRPSHFQKIPVQSSVNRINERLSELAATKRESFLVNLWNAIDNVITLGDCDVYSFSPPPRDQDDDALSFLTQTLVGVEDETTASSLWSFNYFFVNKHQKRILCFACVETMRNETSEEEGESEDRFVTKSLGYSTDASEVDFDSMDPAADVAGGIPVTTT